jgi:XTP/dITP diphosphohydrolase
MASKLERVVLASNNPGKLREFGALLAPLGIELIAQAQLGIGEADEPHPSFVENAIEKARHAAGQSGLPALADDSGICVDALGGAPGVHSARFAALAGGPRDDEANNARLLQQLESKADRSAHYYCVLVLMRSAQDPQPLIAQGVWQGQVIAQRRGEGGFGYDPYFLLPELAMTAAELSAEQKNRVSHRGIAMRDLLRQLQDAGLA